MAKPAGPGAGTGDKMQKTLLLLVLTVCGTASAQQFYRCTDSAGKVTLSDRACDASAKDASRFVLKPNELDSSEGRAANLRQENQRLREQLGQERQYNSAQPAAPSTTSPQCREATIVANRTGKAHDRTTANAACMGADAAAQIEQARAAEKARRRPVITNCHSAGFSNVQCVSR